MVRLRQRETGRVLVVANTHITCNFECPDTQLAQASEPPARFDVKTLARAARADAKDVDGFVCGGGAFSDWSFWPLIFSPCFSSHISFFAFYLTVSSLPPRQSKDQPSLSSARSRWRCCCAGWRASPPAPTA